MRNGLRIGKRSGIHIYVDWIGILIFHLLVSALTATLFLGFYPRWGLAVSWGIALIVSMLFFVSILMHELAHALAAIVRGMRGYSIALFPFYHGAANQLEPMSFHPELAIAIAGPLASLLLGGITALLGDPHILELDQIVSDPVRKFTGLSPLSTLLLWTGFVNVLVGVFNMIPGLPLDGGYMLRSILWAALGDYRRAMKWTGRVGQFVALLLVTAGISTIVLASRAFLGAGLYAGLALVFSGYVLYQAGKQSDLRLAIEDILNRVPFARSMTKDTFSVPPNIPVSSFVNDYIIGPDERAYLVVDSGRLVGLVHLADLRNLPIERWDLTEVGEIMTSASQLVTTASQRTGVDTL